MCPVCLRIQETLRSVFTALPSAPGTVLSRCSGTICYMNSRVRTQPCNFYITSNYHHTTLGIQNLLLTDQMRKGTTSTGTCRVSSTSTFFPLFLPSGHFSLVGVIRTAGEPENNWNENFQSGLNVSMSFQQTDFANRGIIYLFNFNMKSFTNIFISH